MCVCVCVCVCADGREEDVGELAGMAPTPKRVRLANSRALEASLNTGCYPEYLGIEGPYVHNHPDSNNPLDYLHLLWPESLCELMVLETNRYARGNFGPNWIDVDCDEIWTFLGINLLMGIHKPSEIDDCWSGDDLIGIRGIPKHMSRNRFWQIWSNFHLVDNSELSPGDGISSKVKPVLDVLADTFFRSYSPGQELSVDEAMVKYKGHIRKGKVKMPRKPIKEGFKVWCCCCSCCSYLCTFKVYEGKPTDPSTGRPTTDNGM